MHLVPGIFRVLEIDGVTFEEREIALDALLRTANHTLDGVAGSEAQASNLRRRHIDIIRSWEVIGVSRSEERKSVLQYFNDAFPDYLDLSVRELLQDRKHELLLAHYGGVLDLVLFRKRQQFCRGFFLQVFKLDFPHLGTSSGRGGAARARPQKKKRGGGGGGNAQDRLR